MEDKKYDPEIFRKTVLVDWEREYREQTSIPELLVDTFTPRENERIAVIAPNYKQFALFVNQICDYHEANYLKNFIYIKYKEMLRGRPFDSVIVLNGGVENNNHSSWVRFQEMMDVLNWYKIVPVEINDRELFKPIENKNRWQQNH